MTHIQMRSVNNLQQRIGCQERGTPPLYFLMPKYNAQYTGLAQFLLFVIHLWKTPFGFSFLFK